MDQFTSLSLTTSPVLSVHSINKWSGLVVYLRVASVTQIHSSTSKLGQGKQRQHGSHCPFNTPFQCSSNVFLHLPVSILSILYTHTYNTSSSVAPQPFYVGPCQHHHPQTPCLHHLYPHPDLAADTHLDLAAHPWPVPRQHIAFFTATRVFQPLIT